MAPRHRAYAVLVCAATAACSAGTSTVDAVPSAAAALAASHGSAAEVRLALEVQGLPCVEEFRMPDSPAAEQLIGCRIGEEQVVVAHFLDEAQAERFKEAAGRDGRHGAFASTWAVQTATEDLAKEVAAQLAAESVL